MFQVRVNAVKVVLLSLMFLTMVAPISGASAAKLTALIDISSQSMTISLNGSNLYVWKTSTARPGYRTPLGTFTPQRLERSWFSTKYDNAPMPHSIFFYGGYAIHGTTDLKNLGSPASHGCVRLHPDNAKILFDLVKKIGMHSTKVVVRK
jgi:lipoprotein-anchoring transpeptidase ErfK/SrfK